MSSFIIQGGKNLSGTIKVAGFKNAATPIIAATLLSKEEITLHNVPLIEDVKKMLHILVSMGAQITWSDTNSVKINCKDADPEKMDMKLVSAMRSSTLLMGSLVGRFGKVHIKEPGGCQIGSRPLDTHFMGFSKLGIDVERDDHGSKCYILEKKRAAEKDITLSEFSVTGTENMILASVLNHGETTIRIAAAEPSVQDLCWFLNTMGADIEGVGTHTLKIKGVNKLKGGEYFVMPDPIETGTFISLAGATRSKFTIEQTAPDFMSLEIAKYREVGLELDIKYKDLKANQNYRLADIEVSGKVDLKAIKKLHDMPHPGFAPDLIQPFTVLMTQAQGTSLIHDWMYDGRLKYVAELKKMGANIVVSDPHRIVVIGPSALYGKEITSFDLRAGATLIIAALSASGESKVTNIYQVDRGYEMLDKRLSDLGAKIERVED